MRSVLYVSFDGILQPLAYSQVVRVVVGLAERGVPYRLLSLERPQELADGTHVAAVRARLSAAGVEWTALPYDTSGTPKAAASNLGRATAEVVRQAASRSVSLVHARSYHCGAMAEAARSVTRVPYLFDARSYWIDERIVDGRWFQKPAVRLTARTLERRLYRKAAAVVTLTAIQKADIEGGKFGAWTGAPIVNIPTCADYAEFLPRAPGWTARLPETVSLALRGKRVIGIVGSLNRSYHGEATLDLVARALSRAGDLHLLVLSAQTDEWRRLLRGASIDESRATLTVAPHTEMPAYTAAMDFAVMLLAENVAKRASMPTKLAELFAGGVRPVHFGCNAEVGDWVTKAGSGHVLRSLEPAELERAADFMARTKRDTEVLERARARTEPHFSLASGVERYVTLVRQLL